MKKITFLLSFLILTSCASMKTSKPIDNSKQISENQIIVIPYDRPIRESSNEVSQCQEIDFTILKKAPEMIHLLSYTYYLKTLVENQILIKLVALEHNLLIEEITPEEYQEAVQPLFKALIDTKDAKEELNTGIMEFSKNKDDSMGCIDEFKESLSADEQAKYFLYIDDPFFFNYYYYYYSEFDYNMNMNLGQIILKFNSFINEARSGKLNESQQIKQIQNIVDEIRNLKIDEYINVSEKNYRDLNKLHEKLESMFNKTN